MNTHVGLQNQKTVKIPWVNQEWVGGGLGTGGMEKAELGEGWRGRASNNFI